MYKEIKLPVYGIVVQLETTKTEEGCRTGASISTELQKPCPDCGEHGCYHHCEPEGEGPFEFEEDMWERAEFNKRMRVVENFILCQAQWGIDIESENYINALKDLVDIETED